MARDESRRLFERARALIPGGVNSPVRAFRAVGGEPLFLARGAAARVWDADGNAYIDYVGSWGPLILGHAHAGVVEAIGAAARDGTTFGAPTARETELAEAIALAFPAIERVRLVSSGPEATMSALRVARGATGRAKIVKCDGGYHGHADALLAKAGSGVATLGLPDSAGVTEGAARDTIVVPYNDLDSLHAALSAGDIAAFIVEPVAGNMGVVPPAIGYLEGARALCRHHGTILIFDEVITGFRIAYGGAQERWGIGADLTCLGKILGGGLPLAAYGGRADLMAQVAPEGPVYQAGTLSGNPVAVAAGLATLAALRRAPPYDRLAMLAARLESGLLAAAREHFVPASVNRVGSMLTLFFAEAKVVDYASARGCDVERFARFHRGLLERGVYWPPSQFEAAFVSTAHEEADIERTIAAASAALADVATA